MSQSKVVDYNTIKNAMQSVAFIDEVEVFNRTMGKPNNYVPNIPNEKEWMFVYNFILEELEEYVNLVKSIPSGKNTNKTYLINKKELQQKHQMNLSINPKVDSKSQRRVQCKIPLKLFEQYPEYILYRNTEAIVRGVEITKTLQSTPRKRSKKEI